MSKTVSEAKPKSPYAQIALTYLHRKIFWISGAILLAILLGLTVHPLETHSETITIGPIEPAIRDTITRLYRDMDESRAAADLSMIEVMFFGLAWVLVTILAHLKQQIASPRAVILPNYRRPHLLVAAAIALPLLILMPLGISASFALPSLPVLAVAAVFFTLALWAAYFPKWPLSMVLAALYLGSFTPFGGHAFHAALTNTAILPNLLLIALGIAAIAALAHCLMRLREEMPEYSRHILTNSWQTMTMPQTPQSESPRINYNGPFNRFFCSPSYRQFARLAISPPSSRWARLQRWRLAGNPANFTLIIVPIILLQILIMMPLTGSLNIRFFAFELVLLPAIFLPQQALAAWRTFGIESLRPISRAGYLRERAAFFALQFVQTWFILAATMLACTAILAPDVLRNPKLWITLAASALAQFPIFAISIWILCLRSPFAIMAAAGVLAAIGSFAVTLCTDSPLPWLIAIFPIVMVLSSLILLGAYRHWLRADLD